MANRKPVDRKGGSKPAPAPRASALPTSPRAGALIDAAVHPDTLRAILRVLEASDVTRLDWRRGDERLVIQRGAEASHPVVHTISGAPAPAVTSAPVPAPAPAPAAVAEPVQKPGTVITSPFVGTFYRSPSPEAPSFVDVGAVIRKGQVLCIVEAMKLMNEIEAEAPGKIAEVLVDNGHTVEFGQPLFRIEPV